MDDQIMRKTIATYFPFYYGWVIVGVSLVALMVAYGIWWSFPIFYVNILSEFGWSRAGTAFIFTIGSIVYGLGSLPAGALADRLGPRRLLPAACLILASGCLISSVASQKWHFYIAYGVFMGFGTICTGFVPIATILSNWFVRKRGRAMGIALIGNVAPPLLAVPVQKLISVVGWQASYAVLAVVLLVVIAPLTGFFMRTRPQDLGMAPDGFPLPSNSPETRNPAPKAPEVPKVINRQWAETHWSLSNSLRTYQFWALTGVMLTLGIGGGVIMNHLVAMVVDMGQSRDTAALVFSLAGLMAAAGRLSGFISDRLGREVTFTILATLYLCSTFALLTFLGSAQLWTLYLYAFSFGLGSGLSSPTIGSGAADLFGGKNFGSILGFSNIGYGIGLGIGAWAGGAIFDQMGSYHMAVILAIPFFILMAVFFWIMGPRKVRRIITNLSPW